MHAPARTDDRIHRVHQPMIETGAMAQNFFTGHTPNPHERLTSEIRRSAGGPAADARWIVAEPPHRHATDGVAVGGRPTDASLTAIARRLAPHRCTKARITDAGALKKNGRSMSGHRIPAATTPDQ
ncbi:hypothetical protein P2C08_02470 [Xanthomonas perforans]|uniref:Uncharacterized protein n=1 Tax=Xanthomonas euvesicatoria TaxID=456327 RepID=A0AAX4FFU4_XANEU|nr:MULTISPECIES: hypothetical protein [Xanthomonas]MBV6783796.1 hypothetical protein [Xanthomonas campestris pv. uppalii]MBV6856949.1 hypothetical protein [Xanthomonas campestris pv. zingibericola]MCP3038117.1 hypothetical protein [Xanthomonas euvesicatoria pv. allii]MCP3050029.1 hypothetical protein [Xanthomonas euvesicatoria pv. allii]PWH24565.1 hypothetical protein CDO09_07285 [Xanthomonas perforans]